MARPRALEFSQSGIDTGSRGGCTASFHQSAGASHETDFGGRTIVRLSTSEICNCWAQPLVTILFVRGAPIQNGECTPWGLSLAALSREHRGRDTGLRLGGLRRTRRSD